MAKSGRDKDYWFMRLRQTFYDDEEMRQLESLDPGIYGANYGYFVIVLYMKLMTHAIRHDGEMIFYAEIENNKDIVDILIDRNYFHAKQRDMVRSGLQLLVQLQLIEITRGRDRTRLFVPEVQNMTGRSTARADQQRKIDRTKRDQLDSTQPPLLSGEQSSIEGTGRGKYKNVYLSLNEYNDLQVKAEEAKADLERIIGLVSLEKATRGQLDSDDYTACLNRMGIIPIRIK